MAGDAGRGEAIYNEAWIIDLGRFRDEEEVGIIKRDDVGQLLPNVYALNCKTIEIALSIIGWWRGGHAPK